MVGPAWWVRHGETGAGDHEQGLLGGGHIPPDRISNAELQGVHPGTFSPSASAPRTERFRERAVVFVKSRGFGKNAVFGRCATVANRCHSGCSSGGGARTCCVAGPIGWGEKSMCGAPCRMPSAAPGRGVACTQCTIVAQRMPGFISDAHGPNLRADRSRKNSQHRQDRGSEGLEGRVVSVRGALSAPARHGAGHVASFGSGQDVGERSPTAPPTPLRFDAICCELWQDRGGSPKQKTPPRSPVNGAQRRLSGRYVCPRWDSWAYWTPGDLRGLPRKSPVVAVEGGFSVPCAKIDPVTTEDVWGLNPDSNTDRLCVGTWRSRGFQFSPTVGLSSPYSVARQRGRVEELHMHCTFPIRAFRPLSPLNVRICGNRSNCTSNKTFLHVFPLPHLEMS